MITVRIRFLIVAFSIRNTLIALPLGIIIPAAADDRAEASRRREPFRFSARGA
jgi:hypothetical protein